MWQELGGQVAPGEGRQNKTACVRGQTRPRARSLQSSGTTAGSLGNQGGPELEKRRLQKDPWVQASPGRAQKYCWLAWGLSQRALPGVTLP